MNFPGLSVTKQVDNSQILHNKLIKLYSDTSNGTDISATVHEITEYRRSST